MKRFVRKTRKLWLTLLMSALGIVWFSPIVFALFASFKTNKELKLFSKMMNLLPPTQREIVFMRFYQEMSFKEIAETTGVSINTALGRMRYAILNMRRMARKNKLSLEAVY